MLTRRGLIAGGAGLALAGCNAWEEKPAAPHAGVAEIEARLGGRAGVCAIDTGSGKLIGHRGQERFAMASTFKWLLAAGILKRCQDGAMILDEDYALYGRDDLLPNSPVSEANIDPATGMGRMTLAQMGRAIVTVSDNCAANLLLAPMMGPEGFTRFLRDIGDPVTRLDRTETALNENALGDERDTTTPEAMARVMARVLTTEDILRGQFRAMLQEWLMEATTGLDRLRAGFPADWKAGDKTGTGGKGAHNDVAIAFPPGRAPIVIASYFSESTAPDDQKSAAHADIARIVVKGFG